MAPSARKMAPKDRAEPSSASRLLTNSGIAKGVGKGGMWCEIHVRSALLNHTQRSLPPQTDALVEGQQAIKGRSH